MPSLSKTSWKVGLVGATGAVGRKVLSTLEKRMQKGSYSVSELRLWASPKSQGMTIPFNGKNVIVEALSDKISFTGLDVVFFTAGSALARDYGPRAVDQGCCVVDNSSYFRMNEQVPLVVPEVNGELAVHQGKKAIYANPNCTTAQLVMALKPLHDEFGLTSVTVASYQAVSGKGQQGISEFLYQVKKYANGEPYTPQAFPHKIAFNCIPQIDVFAEGDYTGEEWKVMNETRKILNLPHLSVVATCARVPVLNGHSEAVFIRTEKPFIQARAFDVLRSFPGVKVLDVPSQNLYPLAMDVQDQDEVFVGRVRGNPWDSHGASLWIVADNLLKGAALNAVQIAETVLLRA